MPGVEGDACISKIKNCAQCPLASQPSCLTKILPVVSNDGTLIGPAKYFCDDCYEGFYWDPELEFCNMCQIDHCRDCAGEDICVECTADFMVTPD